MFSCSISDSSGRVFVCATFPFSSRVSPPHRTGLQTYGKRRLDSNQLGFGLQTLCPARMPGEALTPVEAALPAELHRFPNLHSAPAPSLMRSALAYPAAVLGSVRGLPGLKTHGWLLSL